MTHLLPLSEIIPFANPEWILECKSVDNLSLHNSIVYHGLMEPFEIVFNGRRAALREGHHRLCAIYLNERLRGQQWPVRVFEEDHPFTHGVDKEVFDRIFGVSD